MRPQHHDTDDSIPRHAHSIRCIASTKTISLTRIVFKQNGKQGETKNLAAALAESTPTQAS